MNESRQTQASFAFLVLAGALSLFPPVTTDIYLPALPQLTAALHGTTGQGQQTLAFYFLGLASGQLFYGPWSDRLGRRPVMLAGVGLYLAATVGCALVQSIQAMIALRFLQALGACAGLVTSAAIVRDRFDHRESARIYSFILMVRGLGPILAPLAGGVIVTFFGWRWIFWALAAFGVALGSWILLGLKETRTEEVKARAGSESPLSAYLAAARNPLIGAYLLTNGLNFGCMFAWIAAAPYLVIGAYRVPALYFGWIFGANAAGFMIASHINGRLVRRHRPDRIMLAGAAIAAVAAALTFIGAFTGWAGPFGVMVPLLVVVSSLGLVSTNAMAGGLSVDPSRAGTVSGLFGTGQFALAGLATAAGAFVSHETAKAMATVIVICSAGALAAALTVARLKKGRPAQSSPG